MTAEELGQALREDDDPFLKRRRGIVGLSLFNVASMGLISLYQMGLLKRVPEPPLPGFDAERVNGSAQAYELLETPDAVLAIGSYAATAALAAMGAPDRAQRMPWIPLAMAAKTVLDATIAAVLFWQQPTRYRSFSFWSVLSAGATVAAVTLSVPEAKVVWTQWRTQADEA